MGRKSTFAERRLIALVESGEWEIDSEGRIWRLMLRHGLKDGSSSLIKVSRRRAEKSLPSGYLTVRALIDGVRVHGMAHRVVWQHFRGDIPDAYEINHDNGIKGDNRPDNLLCGTASENVMHAHRTGLIDQSGERNNASKLTNTQVAQIRLAYDRGGYTMLQLAHQFDVSFQHVSKLVRGTRREVQGGPTKDTDQRHIACERDATTGRFIGHSSLKNPQPKQAAQA
jgi:hypothetical protein